MARHTNDNAKHKPTQRSSNSQPLNNASGSTQPMKPAASSNPRVAAANQAQKRMPVIEKEQPNKKVPLLVLAILVVVLAACAIAFAFMQNSAPSKSDDELLPVIEEEFNENGELVNPIDWNVWLTRNDNIYGWLNIKDTKINYPILQHPVANDYYLYRNVDGEGELNGALYSQVGFNNADLEGDWVTVVYGHTFTDMDTMFTTLHNMEDEEFYNNHQTFYVFTPEKRLEYEVVSAFEFDNSHILATRDMGDLAARTEWYEFVSDPTSINKNVSQLSKPLDPENDHLLILSTCTQPANDNARYLLVAVLRDAQSTEDVNLSLASNVLESKIYTEEELAAMRGESDQPAEEGAE